jgi:hypothetical protein
VNCNLIKPIFSTTLFILLSAALLPGSYNSFLAKDISLSDPATSFVGLQKLDQGKPEGKNQKISLSADGFVLPPAPQHTVFSPIPAPASDITYNLSQARAPPLL